ncbi:MAG: alpha-hydroxy-acid oxidizing protein [Alphaproteobacteria bacterium]|nr:alpha-hydroxy-acid oxidizing protein [Alphaproteobacteria bacterium]
MADEPQQFETLHEIVKAARERLDKNRWDYLMGATETESTLKRNRQAIDQLAFRPRVLRDVSKVDTSTILFGRKLTVPVLLAPIGSLESFEAGGGATAARAAGRFGCALMLSSVCNPGLEAVAEAGPDTARIFQLYVRGDAAFEDDYVRRAVDKGYFAFAVTVDTAHYSRRERDLANRFVKPWRQRATGMDWQAAYDWKRVARFKDTHPDVKLILKGIGTGEDAAACVAHGVDGIYVSNHGGRQLDQGRGSMEVLEEVVAAVAGRATVIVDGGFYRGTDIAKAIALGADCVGIGRLTGLGMAAAGEDGLVRVLELLQEELTIALGLLGARNLGELVPSMVAKALPVVPPHVTSAFPLLAEGY